jgi:ATP-binding cassette subfamily F protein 3
VAVGDIRSKIRGLLGGFLFGEEEIDKKVKVLSGGEKARLALAKLLLTPANLLVLDEPTNHLDMQSKDILKNALIRYEGTLILVSHDRDFLQGLTNKVFEFKDRKIREYIGDIYDFLESRRIRSLKELEVNNAISSSGNVLSDSSDNKQVYERKKQLERDIRKVAGQVEKCEAGIHSLENTITRLNERLTDPTKLEKGEDINLVYQKYTNTQRELDAEILNWEKLNLELDNLKELRGSIN